MPTKTAPAKASPKAKNKPAPRTPVNHPGRSRPKAPVEREGSSYSEHPAVAMEKKVIATLKERTGKSLEEWTALIKKRGPKAEKERAAWLKAEHGLGTNYASWLASCASGTREEGYDPEGLVDAMFAGPKAELRPLYDELLATAFALGSDVTATPCATIVPIRRRFVIAQIKPTTRTRIDFGLALGNLPAKGRLIDTGGFAKKDRITHRIEVSKRSDIDAELKRWLKLAYARDA
jgi:hypothetical protein